MGFYRQAAACEDSTLRSSCSEGGHYSDVPESVSVIRAMIRMPELLQQMLQSLGTMGNSIRQDTLHIRRSGVVDQARVTVNYSIPEESESMYSV